MIPSHDVVQTRRSEFSDSQPHIGHVRHHLPTSPRLHLRRRRPPNQLGRHLHRNLQQHPPLIRQARPTMEHQSEAAKQRPRGTIRINPPHPSTTSIHANSKNARVCSNSSTGPNYQSPMTNGRPKCAPNTPSSKPANPSPASLPSFPTSLPKRTPQSTSPSPPPPPAQPSR